MSRRLLAAAIALLWMLPALLAGATVVHLALGHGHHHGSAHAPHPPFEPAHGASHQDALAELAGHGHSHAPGDPAHRHSDFGLSSDSAARLAAAAAEPAPSTAGPAGATAPAPLLAPPSPWDGGSVLPPKICGPPLLARLCLLRI